MGQTFTVGILLLEENGVPEKVFRQDNQEVHAISCFLSEADEMQYICAH
jgi:hypothetical protein